MTWNIPPHDIKYNMKNHQTQNKYILSRIFIVEKVTWYNNNPAAANNLSQYHITENTACTHQSAV